MSESTTVRSRSGPALLAAATLIPPLLILWTIVRLAVNVPFEDDWDILWFDVASWREGRFGVGSLLDPSSTHNEHPVLFVRLLVLGLGLLTDGNLVAESLAGFGFVVLTLACVWRLSWLTAERPSSSLAPALAFLASLSLFSGTQYGTWLWGMVAFHWCLVNLAAVAIVWAFTEWPGRWLGLGLAMLFAAIGTFSHAAGLILWGLGALAILASGTAERGRHRRLSLVVWSCVTLVVLAILAWTPLGGGGGERAGLLSLLAHPVDVGRFIFTCLGLQWSGGQIDPAVVGGSAILSLPVLVGWILVHRSDRRRVMAPWLLLAVYGLLFAVAITAGRFRHGLGAALAPRYATGTVLFWVGFTGIAAVALATPGRRGPRPWRRYAALALLVAVVAAYAVGYTFGYRRMIHISRNLEFALAELYSPTGADREVMLFLYPPGVEHGDRRVAEFKRLQLGPFAPGTRPHGMRLAAAFAPATDVRNLKGSYSAGDCYVGAHGWAWDTTQPDRPVDVEIFDGDERVGTVTAGWSAEHLLAARKGNGRHAFHYVVPKKLKDGRPHSLTVRAAATGIAIQGSPVRLTCEGAE